jgi:hypothetical protein
MAGDPSLGHLDPAFRYRPVDATVLELRIGVLRGLSKAMASLVDGPRTMPVDYAQLDIHTMQDLCRHFGLVPNADELARMTQRMGFHSKEPARPFEADGVRKRQWFDPDERERIRRELSPGHQQLLAASRRAHRP